MSFFKKLTKEFEELKTSFSDDKDKDKKDENLQGGHPDNADNGELCCCLVPPPCTHGTFPFITPPDIIPRDPVSFDKSGHWTTSFESHFEIPLAFTAEYLDCTLAT